MSEAIVWLDGHLMPVSAARIDPGDRGLLLGEGLFETLLAIDGRAPLAARHLARLSASAAALSIPLDWSSFAIEHALGDVLRANQLQAGTAALRITLTGGPGPRGLLAAQDPRPSLLVAAAPQGPPPATPAQLSLAPFRVAAGSPLRRHKSLSYLENVLARREATARGADEALLLNTEGLVAECSAANLFALRGSRLLTPPITDGALPGITRALLLELAPTAELEPRETQLTLDDLAQADALFLTSSLLGLRPIARLGGRPAQPDLLWPPDPPILPRLQTLLAAAGGPPAPHA